jgi:SAM-dependent methyltransferase
MEFTGERVVPWSVGMRDWVHVLQHHLARYTFALGYVSGKRVLDIGSGAGYGSYILSFLADSVTGIDVSAEAVQFALARFYAPNLTFQCLDIESNYQAANGWQVVTCFECLEHLHNPYELIRGVVQSGATFVWSVPVDDAGCYHRHVYSVGTGRMIVPDSEIYYQSDTGLIVPEREAEFMPKYIVGVHRGVQA